MAIGTVASAQVASGKPVAGHGFAGNLKVAYGTYNIGSAVAQNDVIQMCRTPKGAVILDVAIFGQDIDTGTEALDFDAGYAANGVDAADTDAWGVFVNVTGDGIGNDTASVRLFGAGVTEPIRMHVDAKRYLCRADPEYHRALSPASRQSLEWQGGTFTPEEARRFILQPYGRDAARLRTWDDLAKTPGKPTPGVAHFEKTLARCVKRKD